MRDSPHPRVSVRIRMLGDFGIWIDERSVPASAWRLRKARDLVKVLALAPKRRLHREQVMESLWPGRDAQAAANSLHQALFVARRAIGPPDGVAQRVLAIREKFLTLCAEDDLWVDVDAFRAALERARREPGPRSLRAARELYSGDLLTENPYEAWTVRPREELRRDYLTLLSELARVFDAAGDPAGALDTLRDLVEQDPVDEIAHQNLMRLYARVGQRRRALGQYQFLRTTLRREIDVEPAAESERLYREILEGRLGDASVTLSEKAPDTAAARPVAARAAAAPNNLPLQLSSFIGRDREIRAIRSLIEKTRVVSLTGVGGCGKTRLAIEVAASLDERLVTHGVWLVQLAAVTDPSLILQSVASVLGLRERPGIPLMQLVKAHLEEMRLLLVLDNCEHLVDACADTAQALLSAGPDIRILVTSRRALRLPGEHVFAVPPLSVPDAAAPETMDPEAIKGFASVRLFVERAQAVSPTFALRRENARAVAALCSRLDGLPLALELAASRVAAFPVETVAERLDHRFRLLVGGSPTTPKRHQTLRATLDWSYQLLSAPEQSLARALACFVGGIGLDAAERVAAVGVESADVDEILARLVDHSMVVVDDQAKEARYRLLETVREYGQELLETTGERPTLEARHAEWCVDLARRVADALPRADRERWITRMETEHDNVRAALDRSLATNTARALRLAAAAWPFWLWRGHLVEGRRRLDQVTAVAAERSELLGEVLYGAAALTVRSGNLAEGIALTQKALLMLRDVGKPPAVCRVLNLLGMATWSQDDHAGSEARFSESFSVANHAGFDPGRAAAMQSLAIVRWYAGDSAQARALLRTSLQVFEETSEPATLAPPMLDVAEFLVAQPETGGIRMVWEESFSPIQDVPCRTAAGYVLANRGMLARAEGDLAGAREDLEAALTRFEAIGDARAVAHAMARLGNLARVEGDFAASRELLEESFAIRTRLGETRSAMLTKAGLGNLAAAEGDFQTAATLLGETAATFQRQGDLWGYASALGDLASLALMRGDATAASRTLDEALHVIDRTGRRRWRGWALVQMAAASRQAGEDTLASERIAAALTVFRHIGDRRGEAQCLALESPH